MIGLADASYSPQHKIAVIGFTLLSEEQIHLETINVNQSNLTLIQSPVQGVAKAERLAVEHCITHFQRVYPGQEITIYNDHEAATKEQWPQGVRVLWLPGHTKASSRNNIATEFAVLDKAVRKELRKTLQN